MLLPRGISLLPLAALSFVLAGCAGLVTTRPTMLLPPPMVHAPGLPDNEFPEAAATPPLPASTAPSS